MGCCNSVLINASPDKAWNVLKDFHNLLWSKTVVSKVKKKGAKSGEVSVFLVSENTIYFVLRTSTRKSAKDDTVADFCNPIYHVLLQDLKRHFS